VHVCMCVCVHVVYVCMRVCVCAHVFVCMCVRALWGTPTHGRQSPLCVTLRAQYGFGKINAEVSRYPFYY
jgi:hypothetical protein